MWEYGKLTWPDVNDAVRANKVVLIPVGSVEQHGPHLPIDTDTFIADSLSREVARRSNGAILAAPPIYYSYDEHMMDWPGCITIDIDIFLQYCTQVATSFVRQGFRNVLFINGHGVNVHILEAVVRQVVTRTEAKCAAVNWFFLITDVLREQSRQREGGCHAEQFETSFYLHLDPDSVKMDRAVAEYENFPRKHILSDYDFFIPSGVLFFDWWTRQTASGIKGDPTVATPETGRILFEASVQRITEAALELRGFQRNPRRRFLVSRE